MKIYEIIILGVVIAWAVSVGASRLLPLLFPYRTDQVINVGDSVAAYEGLRVKDCVVMRAPFVIDDGFAKNEYVRLDCGSIYYDVEVLTKYVGTYHDTAITGPRWMEKTREKVLTLNEINLKRHLERVEENREE